MRLLHRFPLLAFALVLLSIVGLCIAQQSVELLLVAGALAAMSWYVTEGPRGRFLPAWVSTILVLAVTLNLVAELLRGDGAWQASIGRFGVWMALIKLYERKTARDYGQLLLLSLLLMMAGAVQSTQLMFGGVLLLYAALGLYVLLLFQLYVADERARLLRRAQTPIGYRLAPPAKPVIGRHLGAQFRLLVLGIAVSGFALSLAMFLLFPRNVGHAVVPVLEPIGPLRRTGFVAAVDLQASTRITSSRRAVMTMTLLDDRDRPVRLDEPVLLRGAVLDRYEGDGRWRPSWSRGRGRPTLVVTAPDMMVPIGGDETSLPARGLTQVIRPSMDQTVLFAMAVPLEIESEEPARVWFDPQTQLLRREGRASRDAYRVRSDPSPSEPRLRALVGRRAWSFPAMPQLGALRRDTIATLARTVLENAGMPVTPPDPDDPATPSRWNVEAARVLQAYLQSGAFTYTTDLSDVTITATDRSDPIERFLLDTRRGHCEYFASAHAALCWNVGIPARLVTGYVAWEYDEPHQEYLVVEANAHAWVEVLAGRQRWLEMDPTPPAALRELHGTDTTLADRLSWFYQRFEGSWNDAVVTYDVETQGRLVRAIDRGWTGRLTVAVQRVREWMVQVNRAFYFGPAGYIWMGVVAFALVLAVLVLIRLMRRSRLVRRQLHLQDVRGRRLQLMLRRLAFYVDMLELLGAAGVAKPHWVPPMQYADQLARERPQAAELVRRLTSMFYAGRYGGRELGRDESRVASELLGRLESVLRARP